MMVLTPTPTRNRERHKSQDMDHVNVDDVKEERHTAKGQNNLA